MNASGPVGLGRFLIGVLARKADSNASSYPSLIKTFYKMLEKAGYNENCSVSYPGLLDPVTRQIEALAVLFDEHRIAFFEKSR